MPKFKRCPKDVAELAASVIAQHESHAPLETADVKVDFVFAFADRDENNEKINNALSKNGMPALGICRKIAPKDRALGHGDAEIALDADWWDGAGDEERAALLDHELHHIAVMMTEDGKAQLDKQGRPEIRLRKHDVEIGWFKVVAERNGQWSMEQQQAKRLMDIAGQYFWPSLVGEQEQKTPKKLKEVAK